MPGKEGPCKAECEISMISQVYQLESITYIIESRKRVINIDNLHMNHLHILANHLHTNHLHINNIR
jgi:hypothetical protein